jgi:hypothetical protein
MKAAATVDTGARQRGLRIRHRREGGVGLLTDELGVVAHSDDV